MEQSIVLGERLTLGYRFRMRTLGLMAAAALGAATSLGHAAMAVAAPAASAGAVVLSISYTPGGGPIFTNAVTSTAWLTGTFTGTFVDIASGAHFEGNATVAGTGAGSATSTAGFDTYSVGMTGASADGSMLRCTSSDLQLYVDRLPGGVAVAGLQGGCVANGIRIAIDTVIVGAWSATNPGAGVTAPETAVSLAGVAGGI